MKMQTVISDGLKLVPFVNTLVLYFYYFIPHTQPGYFAALLKCLPIVSLMGFVFYHGKSQSDRLKAFSRRIFFGLFFSCIGDFCLIWPDLFPLGMLSFAVGHVNYIWAFGFEPLNLPVAAAIYTVTALGCIYLMPGLNGVLLPGVPIYSIILSTMMWRAIARLEFQKNLWTWCRLATCIGSICFVLSDLAIGLDRFKFKIPHDQLIIMSTYYAAQFGLSLSVVDEANRQKLRRD